MGMLAARHDEDRLYEIYREYLPLIVFEQQPGVALRKEALRLRGLFREGKILCPLESLSRHTSPVAFILLLQ